MLERMVERVTSRYPIEKIMPFCKVADNDERPSTDVFKTHDWENRPGSLLHCIYIEKRFDNRAGYYIYREDGEVISGHGYYPFDEDPNIYVLCRGYSIPTYKPKLGKKTLIHMNLLGSVIADRAYKEGYLGLIDTFEKHNEDLAEKLVKITDPKRYPNYHYDTELKEGRIFKPRHYKEGDLRTQPMTMYGKCMIRYTEQIVVYHLFDESYENELINKLSGVKL
jgi:hypothetical protein